MQTIFQRFHAALAERTYESGPPICLRLNGHYDETIDMYYETVDVYIRTAKQAQELINAGQEALRLLEEGSDDDCKEN